MSAKKQDWCLFSQKPCFLPPAFIFFLPNSSSAGSSRGLGSVGGSGGTLCIVNAEKVQEFISVHTGGK